MITKRQKSRKTHDRDLHCITIVGEPASKSNQRQLVKIKGRLVPIKSKKALNYSKAFDQQCRKLKNLYEEDLIIAIKIYYRSRRPDLDESLILDLLQNKIYKNDRQVKLKYIEWGLDKENPRSIIVAGPLDKSEEVINTYQKLVKDA